MQVEQAKADLHVPIVKGVVGIRAGFRTQAVLSDNACEEYEGMQGILVSVVDNCQAEVLPHALQCILGLRMVAAKAAAVELRKDLPPHGLVMLSEGATWRPLHCSRIRLLIATSSCLKVCLASTQSTCI